MKVIPKLLRGKKVKQIPNYSGKFTLKYNGQELGTFNSRLEAQEYFDQNYGGDKYSMVIGNTTDQDGNIVQDLDITREIELPEVVVTAKAPLKTEATTQLVSSRSRRPGNAFYNFSLKDYYNSPALRSYYLKMKESGLDGMSGDMKVLQAMFPELNLLSPTQLLGATARTISDIGHGRFDAGKTMKMYFEGNNGIVTDNFARNHPYWSMGINMGGDFLLANPRNVLNIAESGAQYLDNMARSFGNNMTPPPAMALAGDYSMTVPGTIARTSPSFIPPHLEGWNGVSLIPLTANTPRWFDAATRGDLTGVAGRFYDTKIPSYNTYYSTQLNLRKYLPQLTEDEAAQLSKCKNVLELLKVLNQMVLKYQTPTVQRIISDPEQVLALFDYILGRGPQNIEGILEGSTKGPKLSLADNPAETVITRLGYTSGARPVAGALTASPEGTVWAFGDTPSAPILRNYYKEYYSSKFGMPSRAYNGVLSRGSDIMMPRISASSHNISVGGLEVPLLMHNKRLSQSILYNPSTTSGRILYNFVPEDVRNMEQLGQFLETTPYRPEFNPNTIGPSGRPGAIELVPRVGERHNISGGWMGNRDIITTDNVSEIMTDWQNQTGIRFDNLIDGKTGYRTRGAANVGGSTIIGPESFWNRINFTPLE